MFRYRKLLLIVNRAVYIIAAAMLIAGLVLTTMPKPVQAVADTCVCHIPPANNSVVCSDNNGVINGHLKNHGDYIVTTQAEKDFCSAGNDVPPVSGCTDPTATNYNASATLDDGSCTYPPPVPGCTDPTATNYNPAATVDDGTCTYPPVPVPGCTDPTATNYNPAATVDDGTCTYPPEVVLGCTDSTATNYNPSATQDDGSCTYGTGGPTPDPTLAPPPQSVTASAVLIPVTGMDVTPGMNSLSYGGLGMLGFGLVLSGIRRKLDE